jgi:hypothetical protein
VFTRPLPLTVQSCEDESTIIMASSSLLFNLGLTCHSLYADQRTISASRVAKCYNLALTITCRFTSNNGINAVLRCLILNNLAHLHFEECDYAKSHYSLQRMQALVRTGCLDGSSASHYPMKHDVDELKLNLLCLKKPTAARAA